MRDIKFRGQQINKKHWVYGYLYREKGLYLICENIRYAKAEPIFLDTVGQYTGLKDKNGKEIYEGDILLAPVWFGNLKCVCIYQQENQVSSIQGFGLYSHDGYFRKYRNLVESDEWDEFEVIGNIYENKDLLEEREEK